MPTAQVSVGSMLAAAQSALEHAYPGWKGGTFTMHDWTDCWLAEVGALGEFLGPTLLARLLEDRIESE